MKRRNRYYWTFHHRKKLFYTISSLIVSSVLLFTGIFDIIAVTLLQNPNLSTHKFMKTIMVKRTCHKIDAKISIGLPMLNFFYRYYMQLRFISRSLDSFIPMNQNLTSCRRWHSQLEVSGSIVIFIFSCLGNPCILHHSAGLLLISLVIRMAQELSLSGYYPIEYAVT